MKYIILGLGSVGSLWASLLYESGNTVYGVTRGEHYNKIKKEGLNFIRLDGSNTIIKENEKFRVFSKANNEEFGTLLSDFKKDDCIIITTKAYSLRQIAEDTKELLDNAEYILLLQNGIGNEEIIKEMLPNLVIFRATTTMGAFRSSAGTIKHTGSGFTKLGFPKINYIRNSKDGSQDYIIPEKDIQKYKTKARVLADELAKIGYDVEYVDEIDTILWEKIFVNVGINAPASIYNIPNGDLLKDEK
ncbi:MAG: ketopantoate reductase family protein, partial [Promethearchaeota archaeon]